MASFPVRFRPGLTRIFTATFGVCSIAWVVFSLPVFRAEAVLASPAQHILSQDKYSPEQLKEFKLQLNATAAGSLPPSALSDIAIIRLRLAEADLTSGGKAKDAAASLDELQAAVTAALSANPKSSFLWLTEYWIQNARGADPNTAFKFLRMSYAMGRNEGWIAVRRSPLVLSVFPLLPNDLAEQALDEFAGLVRSHFYPEASNILVGAGWPIHEKLLGRLVQVDEEDRRRFAAILALKDIDGVVVPGVEKRPSRPF